MVNSSDAIGRGVKGPSLRQEHSDANVRAQGFLAINTSLPEIARLSNPDRRLNVIC